MTREKSGTEAAVSDAPENANEEFGRSDQQFGGGAGEVEYGEQPTEVGVDGVVADANVMGAPKLVMDDEREGVVLPGTDPEDLLAPGDVLEEE